MTALAQLGWQRTIFSPQPNRFDLLKLTSPQNEGEHFVQVWRNHSFELVASALPPFLAFSQLDLCVRISGYDDSLSFTPTGAAVELVWLDFSHYEQLEPAELAAWVVSRLDALRAATNAPIVVADAPNATAPAGLNDTLMRWATRTPGASILPLSAIGEGLGDAFFDTRRAALTGTRYSDLPALRQLASSGLGSYRGF